MGRAVRSGSVRHAGEFEHRLLKVLQMENFNFDTFVASAYSTFT